MEEQLVVLVDPWRDKYDRLLEAHEKLQRLNQNLEEKLLKLAENHHAEYTRLSHQVQELTQRLVEARLYIHQLEDENDRYRSDINVVVQLLHCKPSNFVSPKLDTLPEDLQRKVLGQRNGSSCRKEKKIIKVQVPTFPPTDIMYAVDKGKGKKNGEKDREERISAAIMAKVLQERENERKENRKNRCKCASRIVLPTVDSDSQTLPVCTISYSDFNFSEFEDNEEYNEEDNEDVIDEDVYDVKNLSGLPSTSSYSSASKISPDEPPHRPCTTVDDIMKTDLKEEELLPTPLFRRKEIKDHFINKGEDNFHGNESFPSPSSLSSASPVSSSDMAHSSGTEGANYCEGVVSRGSSNSHSNRKLPGRPMSMNFHKEKERTWDKVSSAESYRNESYRNGLVSHWRTTVLVHHPPKSHSYEPLMSTTTTSYGEGGHQQTTFASAASNELLMDSPSDEQPLLHNYSSINNAPLHSTHVTPSAQYYRAQKRTFWTRSSSTTSTETEI